LKIEKVSSSVYRNGDFLSPYNKNSIRLLNPSGSRCETLLTFSKARFNGLFLLIKTLSFRQMRRSEENAANANNSNVELRATCESCESGKKVDGSRRKTTKVERATPITGKITVTITGKRNNRYLHACEKSLNDYFSEEQRGFCFNPHRIMSRFDAANTLFPEDRKRLRQSLISKNVQSWKH
jgi:hypothetical protein